MKSILAIGAFLISTSAFAAAPSTVCGTQMTCGTYVGEADSDGYSVKIDIVEGNQPNEVVLTWANLQNGKDLKTGVETTLTFQADGAFVAKIKNQIYASGICDGLACTYGLIPWMENGKLRAQTGTFHFVKDAVEVSIFVPNMTGDDFVSKGTLSKK